MIDSEWGSDNEFDLQIIIVAMNFGRRDIKIVMASCNPKKVP